MKSKTNLPVYESIAIDVAGRIVDGDISIGQKISGTFLPPGNPQILQY